MIEALPFEAPLDDILFSLRAAGGREDALSTEVITHFARFATDKIAPLDAIGDAQGCRLEDGKVLMPDGFDMVYRQLAEDGWQGLTLPEEHGGQGMDALTLAGVSEIFSGANHALQMVTALVSGAGSVLMRFGTPEQQARLIPLLADGRYLSTMALTEAGAGSDLSTIRCSARRDGDIWRITGEKIFISGGGQNLSEGILHLVLARSSGAKGIKGLSLFACLSHRPDGSLNSVSVNRIEEKMGLHASPTCHMIFDEAEAELIGAEGQGLQAMFAMMNHARIDVALQGVAHAARATDLARRYAAGRVQGRGADGAPVTIDMHADVARMIDSCDRLALGGRALCHLLLAADARGEHDLVDFLTPVAKVFCSEAGITAADLAIQVMGGYGYLREYGAERNWRDARICAIYEGANGIHARGLATRAISVNDGAGAKAFAAFLEKHGLGEEAKHWSSEAERLRQLADPQQEAHDFMRLTGALAHQAACNVLLGAAQVSGQNSRISRVLMLIST